MNQLRGEGRTATYSRHQRVTMSAAVVAQFSLAFLLLTTAGLLARSLVKATNTDPGFRPDHLLSVQIALPQAAYKEAAQITGFLDRLLSRVTTIPGVRQAGVMSDLPTNSTSNVVISVEGRGSETERVDMLFCRGAALETLHIPLFRGRLLQPEDQIGQPRAVVISKELANEVWPHDNPIGRRIRFGVNVPNNDKSWLTVVGVVANVKAQLTKTSPRSLLITTWPDWLNDANLVIRTEGDPRSIEETIRHEISQLDPNLPIGKIETVNQALRESLSAERFRTWALICFAATALLLATFGIGGLLAYNAAQRKREFGIRMALGAKQRDLLLLIFEHCLRLTSAGIVIGFAASIAVTRAFSALLYNTSPIDPVTFLAVPIILALVALGAALLPALHAAHTDPMMALRTE